MEKQRKLIRLDTDDFLEIRLLDDSVKSKGSSKNITSMGICFSSENNWQKDQILLINYFLPDELDSVKLKVVVVWSEFIDPESGYFCGGEITEIEEGKEDQFAHYYLQQLKDRFCK
ncbi:MAG: hypothetical protein GY858_04120 [Candidatus Omnitrophica bacterium]|nr:hypothetical protein [Candidatus Omnitrophota bacterium]